jgi:hypothetical protein
VEVLKPVNLHDAKSDLPNQLGGAISGSSVAFTRVTTGWEP